MPLAKRLLAAGLLLGSALWAQADQQKSKPPEPPEEDEAYAPKEYSFNPLQAAKELKVGNFYFKKGNYKAAAGRFREAAKWNENFAEAYRRLGEALERWKGLDAAREAYAKYLALEPESKDAKEIRKKLARKS